MSEPLRYVQSYRNGQITHVYCNDKKIYVYGKGLVRGAMTEAKPQMICGQTIMRPRYSARPLGRMCERCDYAVKEHKLPSRAKEPLDYVL